MYRIDFIFSKAGKMKYISHLDLMRLFLRAMRRAGFCLKMTQGFSPHPKFSIKRALKLGLESENEEAKVLFNEPISEEDFIEKLNNQLPEGILIKNAKGNLN